MIYGQRKYPPTTYFPYPPMAYWQPEVYNAYRPYPAQVPQNSYNAWLTEHERRLNLMEQRLRNLESQASLFTYPDVDIYHNAYSFHGHK
ncbi:hypothetical protein [Alicyclobacillus acidoterrestris]|uniref:Uncharacterized protein n=1 Tax=Alicyclobacillus acidoterrestris (strain ATCC 49025 / DSM 3922 / CIP 106132 / NCIMB 13137 / GD3B) TaxID=1356854 RepID=T0C4A6_ALIAG|nr:hypothetical protein [Alicyclobacillus acidoterrestris]EPZ47400.1 hypothetical protein N007_06205 [Alicyclobacillus acidoterrestris ATCC 49025]UNO48299.1 hypothetical protein K1I37_16730 [Alicyclobacillus acidoterrestris]